MTIFKFHQYIFTISKLSPLEKGRALHLNPLYSKMICAKFGWNWPSGSGEDDFSNSSMIFSNFMILKRAETFIWTKLNSLHPEMIWAKFGWNWPSCSGEDDFLEFVNVLLQFCNYLPLASLVKIGPVVLEKKMKMWIFYNNKDFDDGQQTNFVQKRSLESSAQVSWKKFQRRIFLSEVISNLAFDL